MSPTRRIAAPVLALVLVLVALACAERPLGDAGGETGAEDAGPVAGELYGECLEVADCFDEWCVHPAGEPGFCTYPCVEGCMSSEALGGTATETCLPVAGEEVCALDCAGGKSCPPGMRCEQIEAGGEARSICF